MKHFFTICVCLFSLAANQFAKAQTCHAGVITAAHDTLCAGISFQLTVTGSSGNIQWQSATTDTFADIKGATDTLLKASPLIKTTYFRVVVSNGSCADTSALFKVFVPAQLNIYFTTTNTGNNTISFNSDSSTGNIVRYHWDFGDGDTSNVADPFLTFTIDTTYYVCLTAFDRFDCSYTFCRYVDNGTDNYPPACSPFFNVSYSGDTVSFSGFGGAECGWAFGDGTFGNGSHITHVYSFSGSYQVCLSVTDPECYGGSTCRYVYPGMSAVAPVSANQPALIVYPNPCTDCEIKGIQNPNDLLVTDLLGRVIPVSFSKQSNGYGLNFPFAGSGMYLVKNVRTGEVVKVVKE